MKYRFKSENHKQEFANNGYDFELENKEGITFNQAIVNFLDSEGLEEFYISEPVRRCEFCIMIDGVPAEIIHGNEVLKFHMYGEDMDHFFSVV